MKAADWKRIAARANAHHPHLRRTVLEAAELAMANRHVLPGTKGEPFFVGEPVGWTKDAVGDPEYLYTLNRMYHWRPLCRADALTGEPRYAQKVLGEWNDWLQSCPPPDLAQKETPAELHGGSPWHLLQVGLRAADSWAFAWDYLTETAQMPPALAVQIVESMRWHGEILAKYSPEFWPRADHNHHLTEMVGLLGIACRFRQLPKADEWRKLAIERLELCLAVQITDCGGQIEGCPHYQNITLREFTHALLLAQQHGFAFSDAFVEKYRRAVVYSLHATRSNGQIVPWGDSDVSYSSIDAALGSYLALGDSEALRVLSQIVEPSVFARHCETFLWEIADFEAILEEVRCIPEIWPALLQWHRDLSQVSARTAWTAGALCLFFACRTPINNGHAHLDPLSFDFSAFGQPILVDPGRFCYREDNDRRLFKSAFWHNTLTINEREPFEYRSTFEFGPQREGEIENVWQSVRFLAMAGAHSNYAPAILRRALALIDGRFLLVLDKITGLESNSSVQLNFHFDSTVLNWNGATKSATARCGEVEVTLHFASNEASSHEFCGEVLDARISDVLDVARPSQRLKIRHLRGHTTRVYATLVQVAPTSQEILLPSHFAVRAANENEVRSDFVVRGVRYECVWSSEGFDLSVGSGKVVTRHH